MPAAAQGLGRPSQRRRDEIRRGAGVGWVAQVWYLGRATEGELLHEDAAVRREALRTLARAVRLSGARALERTCGGACVGWWWGLARRRRRSRHLSAAFAHGRRHARAAASAVGGWRGGRRRSWQAAASAVGGGAPPS
eukprot:4926723-Prymnesium_polylepis.1